MSDMDPGVIRELEEIATLYKDDLYGYRRDVLHRDHEDWQQRVGLDIQRFKRNSISSGHGIGKTGFLADCIHWFISTRPRPAIVATAGTESQLKTKLWRELSRINAVAENRHWFKWKAESFTAFGDPTQTAVALNWSENNPHAFAGTHEDHVLGVFDEGSTIARPIYNTFAGAMSTAGARWLIAGNPTESEGYFFDATHGKLVGKKTIDFQRGMWRAHVIDCFSSTRVDPSYPEEIELEHGKDSDEYRVRVLGVPPRQSASQFISQELLNAAHERDLPMFDRWPLIIGADVGRGDRSTLCPRRGRIALPYKVFNGIRTTDFAREIKREIDFWTSEGLFANVIIEELGMGVGVIETLEDDGYGDHITGVNTGTASQWPELYANLRCEMWGEFKSWLETAMLVNEIELNEDLLNMRKKSSGDSKLRLETKQEMRRRGVRSPDIGDGYALTFAETFDLLPETKDAYRDDYSQAAADTGSWMAG